MGELTELTPEDFEILLIYHYGELVLFFRRDLFQKNIGLPRALSRPLGSVREAQRQLFKYFLDG